MTLTVAGWIFTIVLILIVLGFSIYIGIIHQSFGTAFLGFLAFSIVAEILWCIVFGISPSEYSQVSKEIVSIKQDRKISGQFFLGTGSIDDRPTYIMYAKEGNNTYKLLEVYTSDYYIVENDNVIPNITYRGFHRTWMYTSHMDSQYSWGTIYVPKGTIQVKFQL